MDKELGTAKDAPTELQITAALIKCEPPAHATFAEAGGNIKELQLSVARVPSRAVQQHYENP